MGCHLQAFRGEKQARPPQSEACALLQGDLLTNSRRFHGRQMQSQSSREGVERELVPFVRRFRERGAASR
jgi:hypothetical protein